LSFVLVLPGSRDSQDPYMSRARIESDAATRFEQWGGLERLRACEAVYRQR
jgi:hypothetical protein